MTVKTGAALFRFMRANRLLLAGTACLLLLSEINGALVQHMLQGAAFDPNYRLSANIHVQMALLAAGIVLITVGLLRGRSHNTPVLPVSHKRISGGHLAALTAVTLLAFVMRAWNLENEVHSLIDEYQIVDSVNRLNDNPTTPLLSAFDQIAAFPWLWSYGEKLATDILGHTLAGLRIQSAIVGTLTVLAVYHLARALFNRQAGLIAALLMAAFPPHVHFSRLSMLLIMSPLIGTLALYFVVRALQTGSRRFYVLCGVMLGLLPYYDESGRLVFPLLIAGWLVALWLRGSPMRAKRQGIVVLLGAMLLVSFPVYYTMAGYRAPFLPRLEQNAPADGTDWTTLLLTGSGMNNLGVLLEKRLLPPFLHYVLLPDTSELYYGGSTALILPWLVPLFIAGVWSARRRFGGGMLLLWVTGVALGNTLLRWNTWSARFMGAAPALMIFCTAGVYFSAGAFQRFRHQRTDFSSTPPADDFSPLLSRYALTIAALILSLSQMVYYFGVHLPEYRATIQPFPDYADVAFRARELHPPVQVYFIYSDLAYPLHFAPLFKFWNASVLMTSTEYWNVTGDMLAALPDDAPYAFFVDQRDAQTLEQLREWWGELPLPQFSPYNIAPHRQYALYLFPAEGTAKAT